MRIPVYNKQGELLTHVEYRNDVGALNIKIAPAPEDTPDMRKFSGTFIFQPGASVADSKFVEVDTLEFLCVGDGELFDLNF
jgi:hypothetical protein